MKSFEMLTEEKNIQRYSREILLEMIDKRNVIPLDVEDIQNVLEKGSIYLSGKANSMEELKSQYNTFENAMAVLVLQESNALNGKRVSKCMDIIDEAANEHAIIYLTGKSNSTMHSSEQRFTWFVVKHKETI